MHFRELSCPQTRFDSVPLPNNDVEWCAGFNEKRCISVSGRPDHRNPASEAKSTPNRAYPQREKTAEGKSWNLHGVNRKWAQRSQTEDGDRTVTFPAQTCAWNLSKRSKRATAKGKFELRMTKRHLPPPPLDIPGSCRDVFSLEASSANAAGVSRPFRHHGSAVRLLMPMTQVLEIISMSSSTIAGVLYMLKVKVGHKSALSLVGESTSTVLKNGQDTIWAHLVLNLTIRFGPPTFSGSDIFYILHRGANLGEQERPAASRSDALFTKPSFAIIFPTVWSRNSNPLDSWRAIIAFLAPRFAGNGKATRSLAPDQCKG